MSTDSDTELLRASLVLSPYREQIDQLNHILVDLLAKRMEICRGVARVKCANNIAMMQPQRVTSTLDQMKLLAPSRQLRPEYLAEIFNIIIEETCEEERRLMDAISNSKKEG